MSIIIVPNSTFSTPASTQNDLLSFSDDGYTIFYPDDTAIGGHTFEVTLPDFSQFEQYAGYTEWKLWWTVEQLVTPTYLVYFQNSSVGAVLAGGNWPAAVNGVITRLRDLYISPPATLLPEGVYSNKIRVYVEAKDTNGNVVVIAEKLYPVKLIKSAEFTPGIAASYFGSPAPLTFVYIKDSLELQPQSFFIFSNADVTAVPSLPIALLGITPSVVSGDGQYTLFTIGYGEPSLQPAPGQYTGHIVVSASGADPVQVPVVVIVIEAGEDPVILIPDSLEFTAVIGESPDPAPSAVALLTEGSWSIAELPAWLAVSQVSGEGNAVLYFSVQGYGGLPVGQYAYDVVISTSEGSATVSVLLNVAIYCATALTSGGLFFCDDLDYLDFTSPNTNSRIVITLSCKAYNISLIGNKTYSRIYELPLFEGKGQFHPGTVVSELFDSATALEDYIDDFTINHSRAQYRPSLVSVYFTELSYEDDTELRSGSIANIRMARGRRPSLSESNTGVVNVMGQEFSRITRNSVINCNFSLFAPAVILVKKNAVVIDTLNLYNDGANVFHSYFRFNEDVKPGDVIEVMLKGDFSRTKRFLVFPEGVESTYVFFENKNGLIECFEFTGRRRLLSGYTHTTQDTFKDLYSYKEKVKSENKQTVAVSSGYLLPADHRIIDAIIKSSRVWLAFDSFLGVKYQADATTTKITNADTSDTEPSFDLEFNLLDNADVSIFMQ